LRRQQPERETHGKHTSATLLLVLSLAPVLIGD
jgi:hypothetical protein